MSHVALIHGYGTGLSVGRIRRRESDDAGFTVWQQALQNKQAAAFRWEEQQHFSLAQALNINRQVQFYKREQVKANQIEILKNLEEFLLLEQPRIIFAHSLGVRLLYNFLQQFNFPDSVQQLIFSQADIPANSTVPNRSGYVITNYHCFWDVTLHTSAAVNGYRPAGLFGFTDPHVKNKFYPLYRTWNLHRSALHDINLRDRLLRELTYNPTLLP